jgi:hypothetical protein
MADVPVTGFRKCGIQKLTSLKIQCHAITNIYPEATSVVQQIRKVLSDIENLAGCTPAIVGESSVWTTIVNSAEDNRVNFCKSLDGKPLFRALYGIFTVTLNEPKAVLKVSAQTGQSGVVKELQWKQQARMTFGK